MTKGLESMIKDEAAEEMLERYKGGLVLAMNTYELGQTQFTQQH